MYKFIATLVTGALAFAPVANAEQLTYGTYFKAGHNIIVDAVKPYLDEVTQKTNNSLTFKLFTDGTVVGATTAAKGIQQGLVDMGTILPIYVPSTFPMTALLSSLPLSQTNSLIETGVINELFFLDCDECQPEWANTNIKPLGMYGSSPYLLQCSKEINELDDLKGKRIQGTGEFGSVASALGGLPIGLTGSELYSGMSQGTLDCVIGTVAWLDTYGLKDVVKYIVDVPLGVFRPVSQMNINSKKWNKLSKEQQQAMIDGLPAMVANSAYGYAEEDRTARDKGLAAGIKFAPPPEGFMQAFEKVSNEGGERFIKLAKKNGMKNPQRLLDRYLELQQEWGDIVANVKSKDDYEAALRDRIFTKVKWSDK
ncbi:hypothetical protein D7I39_06785 [Allopusillimonas ginsengisoli]|nr:hypothetical protein D7I39_06785 [Allopusillimonas ginsengisoli]